MKKTYILRCKNISKNFSGIHALTNVDFEIKKGEVLGLVGENGAGKSTLIKVIAGVHKPDNGKIELFGEEFHPQNTHHVINKGVITIHQELSVIPNLDVVNNIFLNMEYHKFGVLDFVDKKGMAKDSKRILKELGIDIPLNILLEDLPISSQQMVEIGRAINRNAKVLLMDEPTSSLSQPEVKKLFSIVRKLRDDGVSVVFVSHRLEEVLEITDRIIVLRDGRRVGELQTKDTNQDEIFISDVILEVKDLSGTNFVKDISFQLRKGEILGLAGLVGAGRTELANLLFGVDKRESGQILIDNKSVMIANPSDAVNLGISYIPEDRKTHGLLMNMDIKDNATIASLS
ncbi:MAG: sugar ABC transporter ATP-binding protein, partial [Promethearchaeota archaeon]